MPSTIRRCFLLAVLLAAPLLSGCSDGRSHHQSPQQKTQAYRLKAQAYLRNHRADIHHARARALRYTRLKVQRAKCRLHPKDKRACGRQQSGKHGAKH